MLRLSVVLLCDHANFCAVLKFSWTYAYQHASTRYLYMYSSFHYALGDPKDQQQHLTDVIATFRLAVAL